MPIYNEPIRVDTANNQVVRIHWRQQVFTVTAVTDFWVSERYWWKTADERREYVEVHTDGGDLVIFKENREWVLSWKFD